jgi:hypothetical protein
VDGEVRLPAVARRSDWNAELTETHAHSLSPQGRAALAECWLNDAREEHASIASFARFVLDLLAFAAPFELIRDANQALADETAHASACFALASHYAGQSFGPGLLDVTGVGPSATLEHAAVSAVREGCVSETLAAFVAGERARRATVPAVRAVLERIAEDETRHAELAFRFVRWAIETGGEAVRTSVARAFAGLATTAAPSDLESEERSLAEHGWLTKAERCALEALALHEIVEPCAQALLEDGPNRVATLPVAERAVIG